jgi:hypothetical protein
MLRTDRGEWRRKFGPVSDRVFVTSTSSSTIITRSAAPPCQLFSFLPEDRCRVHNKLLCYLISN